MTTQVSHGIRISVRTEFEPSYSDPGQPHFVFSYRIKIVNESRQTVQLMRRRWNIFDSSGEIRTVEGEGVVGQKPVLSPGETYEYESACNLTTEMGRMAGCYTLRRRDDGTEFQVDVPGFQMIVPFRLN